MDHPACQWNQHTRKQKTVPIHYRYQSSTTPLQILRPICHWSGQQSSLPCFASFTSNTPPALYSYKVPFIQFVFQDHRDHSVLSVSVLELFVGDLRRDPGPLKLVSFLSREEAARIITRDVGSAAIRRSATLFSFAKLHRGSGLTQTDRANTTRIRICIYQIQVESKSTKVQVQVL